jgi:hypothetical protein
MTIVRWVLLAAVAGCVPDEGACVWTANGSCHETSEASCAEDDAVQGGSTFHDGETCAGLGCTPTSDDPNEAWYSCPQDAET